MRDRNELAKRAAELGGLPVLVCRPGSPAELAGVRYGDILLGVNGIKTPDWASYIAARGKNTQRMQLELFRDGETVTVEIELGGATPFELGGNDKN